MDRMKGSACLKRYSFQSSRGLQAVNQFRPSKSKGIVQLRFLKFQRGNLFWTKLQQSKSYRKLTMKSSETWIKSWISELKALHLIMKTTNTTSLLKHITRHLTISWTELMRLRLWLKRRKASKRKSEMKIKEKKTCISSLEQGCSYMMTGLTWFYFTSMSHLHPQFYNKCFCQFRHHITFKSF